MDSSRLQISDAELMAQLCAGQQDRLGLLMRRYYSPLLRVAWSKLGHRQTAEDVVQETFIAVYASRLTYNSSFSFRTWLWTILLNLCRRELRRRRSKPAQVLDFDFQSSGLPIELTTGECAVTRLLLQEKREQVVQALDQLPEPQADAIRLRFYGALPYQEIALTMECTLSGAKRRVKTGLLKLADLLQSHKEEEA